MNIRIFFSSPGDVRMERETAKRIVDRLQSEIGGGAAIEPYFWEHEVMVATKDYQENIPHMDDFDIVVCILWSRLGTPLDPARHPRPGGGGFASGTEYEFFTAMRAHEVKGTPDIFVFRNSTEPRRPSRPREAREAVDREIDRLDSFFDSYFQDNQFFTRAINIYSTLGEFEEKLTIALRSYITGRIPNAPSKQIKKPKYDRQPYLGLSAFNYEDAPVFFGRTAQIGEIITAYQAQELESQSAADAPPKHFVLILGSSGSGKSSLARAGVLPMLTNPGVIEGANAWRTAIFKPADAPGDPILALVQSLIDSRALPELFSDGTTPREVADLIRSQPQGGGLLLRQALTQAGALALTKQKHELEEKLALLISENREEDAKALREKIHNLKAPSVRIALLADQLEELFTSDLSPDTLGSFIGILIALANSGRVFVMATLRSDFYPRCLEHPDLIALMQGNGTYALPAPAASDIGQMIRQPAAIAGLTFEGNPSTGENLDDLLRDAALKDPAALPLLSYTLEQLYERREDDGTLTLQAYRELGGLEGAIGTRAETVFTSLPYDAQAAFDGLCKQLITLCEGGEPTRRRASYPTLTRTPEAKTLLDALINARLLSADQSPAGERVVSVAHEALLRHWPRLVAWVQENRLFLNTRTRVASRMADWIEKNKSDDYLISRGPNLSAAESILTGHLAALDPLEIEFIGKSAERVRREDQRKLRNARLITMGAVVLCLIAVAGGLFAMAAKRHAQRERNAALEQEKLANKATVKAVASDARSAYLLGIERLESGHYSDGINNLAQTLDIEPQHVGAQTRLYSELLYSLPRAVPIRSVVSASQMRQRITGSYSSGKQYITYISEDKSPEIFDLDKREIVPGPWSEGKKNIAPAFNYRSDHLLDIQEEEGGKYNFRVWNIAAKKVGASVIHGGADFHSMLITADGKSFVFALISGDVQIVSTETGEVTDSWKQSGSSAWVSEIPGKFIISTYRDSIVIHNLLTGKRKTIAAPEGFSFQDGRTTFGSDIFVSQSYKLTDSGIINRFAFHDANTGEPVPDSRVVELTDYVQDYRPAENGLSVAIALSQKGTRMIDAFSASADKSLLSEHSAAKVAFSHDGRHLAAASEEGTVIVFDIRTGKPILAPIPHGRKLEDLIMTWRGRYLLTSTVTTATVWDLSVGTGLAQPIGLPEAAKYAMMKDNTLTVQTKSHIHRIDTSTLTRDPVPTILAYEISLNNEPLNRHAVLLDGGVIAFYGHAAGDADQKKIAEWKCPAKAIDLWAFSPDSSVFYGAEGDRYWAVNPEDGGLMKEFSIGGSKINNIIPTPDNRYVFSLYAKDPYGYDHGIHCRDMKSGAEVPITFPDPQRSQIRSPSFIVSKDSRWLAVATTSTGASSLGVTFLWDLKDLSKPARELAHRGTIRQMEFSPDGKSIALATHNSGIQIFSLETAGLIAPIFNPGGTMLDVIAFSPDSSTIATSIQLATESKETPAEVRVWDWREAVPITRPFRVPTTISHLFFTNDGRSLFSVSPRKGNAQESVVLGWEITPPAETASLLNTLAQTATGYQVKAGSLPTTVDSFLSWQAIRKAKPDSWFLKSPEERSVAPAFHVDSMRWIKDELVEIDTLTSAMPCVALSNAATAYWKQANLRKINDSLASLSPDSPEHKERLLLSKELAQAIGQLLMIPERNPEAHTLVPYYLALQARSAGDTERQKKYALLAYGRNPDNIDCVDLAAKIYEETGNYKSATPILRKARDLAPENNNIRYRLGTALWTAGRKTEAQVEFTHALESGKILGLEKAIILTYMGRGSEALPEFVKLAESEKGQSAEKTYGLAGLVYLVSGHLGAGDEETALGFFEQLATAAPGVTEPANIRNANLHPLLTESLLSALELYHAKHPTPPPASPE